MMIASECDKQVGPWDERFFLYSEEIDYATRARGHGFKIEYLPTARVLHSGGGSGTSDELDALLAVNRIRYAEKWDHWPRVFRGIVIFHELMRAYRRKHRITLRILLQRSSWSDLILKLQGSGTGPPQEHFDAGIRASIGAEPNVQVSSGKVISCD